MKFKDISIKKRPDTKKIYLVYNKNLHIFQKKDSISFSNLSLKIIFTSFLYYIFPYANISSPFLIAKEEI